MLNFDERDLLAFADHAGFSEIDVTLEIRIGPVGPVRWEELVRAQQPPPYPLTTLQEAMDRSLTADEVRTFENQLRPLVESGSGTSRNATAYLRAIKS